MYQGRCDVEMLRHLRDEAADCRQLAREIKDAASIEMLLERAMQLEARAAALEEQYRRHPPDPAPGDDASPDSPLAAPAACAATDRAR
jgi:hypothetical protein